MAPVIHCFAGNISLFPRTTFISRKDIQLKKCSVSGKYTRLTSYYRRLPASASSIGLFQIYKSGCGSKHRSKIPTVAAVGTDVIVEESNPDVSGDNADETLEIPPKSSETSEAPPETPAVNTTARNKRLRPVRKSEMPPLKDEELIPGASFTGKVRSIQPFGAFVDFGAFTDGLVHVSRMSDGYVKDVGAVVSIGQEVKVRIVEANMESGRISLTMRDSDDTSKLQQRDASSSGSSDKPRPVRKNDGRSNQKRGEVQKTSKLVKGQVLDGTVKKITRSGAFVSFTDGEEGFLPVSEETEGFGNIMGNSSLQAGQEVNVRVLRISRGKVTLTMKKEEDVEGMNKQLNQGVVHVATNPFELAFRKNKDIAAFLEQEKSKKASENLSMPKTYEQKEVGESVTMSNTLEVSDSTAEDPIDVSPASSILIGNEKPTSEELHEDTSVDSFSSQPVSYEEKSISSSAQNVDAVPEILPEDEDKSKTLSGSFSDPVLDEVPPPEEVKDSIAPVESAKDELNNSKSLIPEESEFSSNDPSISFATDEVKETGVTTTTEHKVSSESSSAENIESSPSSLIGGEIATLGVINLDTQSSGENSDQILNSEGATEPQLVETKMSSSDSKDVNANASEASNGQTVIPDQGGVSKATVSPVLVKQLREETGAGMMDCKKALTETFGDIVKAQEFLRKKGLASADKKASRATAEGRVGSYIHDNRIGVLIEVNCETDFVARGDIFKELVDDLAMQVAACPQVRYLATEDVPEEFVKKEREIEMQKEDLLTKPEQIRSKIVDGRIRKRLEEFALLEQPYIKNDKVVVKDFVKQTIATIGENINVARFVRYNLGEGLEKKSQDFAAEVAAQTAAKSSPAAPRDESAEPQEPVEKAPTVTVSAALVKQLREETGAGMMDCKKALTETGGDLEKAQEYLRKKGLSSADKKSSRLAAEGRISSYIHDTRIGVLLEVNSETDFVARNEKFKELVDDLAMQVVACPQVEYVSVEDIPESIVSKEKEIEMQREDLKSKPEHIREKIVEGRISKRLGELALLEQAFIKDDSVMVKDLVKQTVASLGENIRVRRFVRFTLGESKD